MESCCWDRSCWCFQFKPPPCQARADGRVMLPCEGQFHLKKSLLLKWIVFGSGSNNDMALLSSTRYYFEPFYLNFDKLIVKIQCTLGSTTPTNAFWTIRNPAFKTWVAMSALVSWNFVDSFASVSGVSRDNYGLLMTMLDASTTLFYQTWMQRLCHHL